MRKCVDSPRVGQDDEECQVVDPETKKFVYLQWKRDGQPPTPAMKTWHHRTGETISLYRFAAAQNPLPIIPSINEMKVRLRTNDKNFKATPRIIVD